MTAGRIAKRSPKKSKVKPGYTSFLGYPRLASPFFTTHRVEPSSSPLVPADCLADREYSAYFLRTRDIASASLFIQ